MSPVEKKKPIITLTMDLFRFVCISYRYLILSPSVSNTDYIVEKEKKTKKSFKHSLSFNISTEKTSAMVQTWQGSPQESVGTEIHQTHIRREKEDEWSDTVAVN